MAEAHRESLAPALASPRRGASVAALWLALGVAFSPVLFDLVQHWVAHPWARYSAVFVPLSLWVARVVPVANEGGGKRDAILWVSCGVALALISVGGGMSRYGRLGLLLALLGMFRMTGRPPLPVCALVALSIPIPEAVLRRFSPWLETSLLEVAGAIVSGVGGTLQIVVEPHQAAEAVVAGAALSVVPANTGIPLVVLLSGLGYACGLLGAVSLRASLRRGATWALFALPAQLLVLVAALGVLSFGGPESLARGIVAQAGWLALSALGLGLCWQSARASRSPRPE